MAKQKLVWCQALGSDYKSEPAKEALRLMINKNVVFTNKIYREHFKVSNQTCVRDMKFLSQLDLAIIEGKGKNVKYKAK
ncbi:MAG: hypothetical protein ABIJ91_00170 [Candidatus Kuenenbacteria bacterium]